MPWSREKELAKIEFNSSQPWHPFLICKLTSVEWFHIKPGRTAHDGQHAQAEAFSCDIVFEINSCISFLSPSVVCRTKHGGRFFSAPKPRGRPGRRYLAKLFRGDLDKKTSEKASRLGHTAFPIYGRGVGMSEQDSLRFLRKMVVEGYIEERLYKTQYATVAYAELTLKSRQALVGGPKPKIFLHVTADKKRKSIASDLLARTAVSEAKALKEKHIVKYRDVFTRCLQTLTETVTQIADESRLSSPYAIISQEGLEQVAALLPRTNSDLVQVDSMTSSKVERYGARIMAALKSFWKEVDERDEAEMRQQLEKLKDVQPPSVQSSSDTNNSAGSSSYVPNGKFAPRFGRANSGRGRGAGNFGRPKATPRVHKKSSRGSSQGSFSFIPPIACFGLQNMLFHISGNLYRVILYPIISSPFILDGHASVTLVKPAHRLQPGAAIIALWMRSIGAFCVDARLGTCL
ncbi:unnamed protein product [Haemonchus placei]|uniref:DNA 3'-5' helicase n=1 Tax=Haemonchus placei TaxID=6290 RepID=A0A0N4X081_HAEPC|nr:unnamed protein product [Haemonchus placei]